MATTENTRRLSDVVFYVKDDLFDYLPSHIPFVKGRRYSAWIDSGAKAALPKVLQAMDDLKVRDDEMPLIIQTHSHGDHIGNNVALKKKTGCLIAGHGYYAKWHYDLEVHYQEYMRPVPELIPDTAELRQGLDDWFDSPHEIDIYIDKQNEFDLGGGVRLTGLQTPGHMKNDVAWFEHSTKTLILGDALTNLDWPHFHTHLTVSGYRSTIKTIKAAIRDLDVKFVMSTHMGPLTPEQTLQKADESNAFLDKVDAHLMQLMKSKQRVTLEELWTELSARMEKTKDFMGVPLIHAHVEDALARGLIKEVSSLTYSMR